MGAGLVSDHVPSLLAVFDSDTWAPKLRVISSEIWAAGHQPEQLNYYTPVANIVIEGNTYQRQHIVSDVSVKIFVIVSHLHVRRWTSPRVLVGPH